MRMSGCGVEACGCGGEGGVSGGGWGVGGVGGGVDMVLEASLMTCPPSLPSSLTNLLHFPTFSPLFLFLSFHFLYLFTLLLPFSVSSKFFVVLSFLLNSKDLLCLPSIFFGHFHTFTALIFFPPLVSFQLDPFYCLFERYSEVSLHL